MKLFENRKSIIKIISAVLSFLIYFSGYAQPADNQEDWKKNLVTTLGSPLVWNLWPKESPGDVDVLPPEYDTTKPDGNLVAGKRVIRITNVSVPQLAIYKPDPEIDTKTAVIIAPGGGHWILAYDLEGTEIAEWLNGLGVTAIILKYRVPGQHWDQEKKWLSAAQDGQRAVSLVRSRAEEIGVDPDRIGIMGFSAGGTPVLHTSLVNERYYEAVDDVDKVSFRPNFAAPIYSVGPPENAVYGDDCPPFFMLVTNDDFGQLGMASMYIALKKANKSAELHIYESGGHGYGLRKTDKPVTSWPDRMEDWMRKLGFLGH
jgi:acetyl esterase/lipase